MKQLVTRSEFARLSGKSPSTITKACLKSLAPATVGKRIDASHPAAIAYINNRTGNTTIVSGWTAKNEAKKLEALEKLRGENFTDMTLREVVTQFGTDPAFSDWLKAIRLIEDVNEKRLKNEQTISELVNRQLVRTGVVEPFEVVCDRLLTDGAKKIANHVTTMSGAGCSVAECEAYVADQISSFIKLLKNKALRVLNPAVSGCK